MRDDEQDPTETVGMSKVEMPAVRPLLARGAQVGRYVILRTIGQGGMGVVYAGYDPELERKVALKLLRPGRSRGEAGRLRLLREAQAIARLSHPNVVTVFDTGSFGDQVFVAMELVPGRTLREWLGDSGLGRGRRPWREVVPLFLAAGRGLAAAHAAGLVHRDFKPENVLLGDDGRVRVVDFGLARPAGTEAAGEEGGLVSSPLSSGILGSPITGHGVVLGTPAYMAPEQLGGGAADARSDQYGFCVALWEALYGARPAPGTPPEAPAGSRVPPWLRQALLRGLSADPADRHPSMDALLAVLGRDRSILRRRVLAAAAVLIVAGAAGLAWERSRQELCRGGEDRVAGLWNVPRKQAVRAAFAASRATYAELSWRTVESALDRHFGAWAAAHREACAATRIRGEQSEDLLDRRMSCLDQRFREAGALVDVFAHADPGVVKNAVNAAGKLQGMEECSDAAALMAPVSRPRDPEARRRIAAVEQRLARAQALSDAGRDAAALRIVKGLEAAARAAAYRPLEARVLYLMGYSQILLGQSRDAERSLFDAVLAAEAGADREMISLAAAQLARAVGFEQSRREEGRRWARFAKSSIEGTQGNPAIQVRVLNSLGTLLQRDGLYAEEEATYRQAVDLAERGLGPDNPLTAAVLSNLGLALLLQGRNEEALQVSLRGLAIGRRVLPADHPNLGTSYNTLGNACTELGRKDEALAMYRKAREIFAASYGEGHPMTAGADGNLGVTLKDLGRNREAEELYRKSLAELQANGPDSPNTAIALSDLGELLVMEKRYAEALPDYQRALAINGKLLGPAHPEFAYDLRGVGDVLAGLGRTREAVPWLERALTIQESAQDTPEQLANSRYHLARALWAVGDRGRALRLAHQAYRVYAGTRGESTREMAAEAAAWLRVRGETP